MKAENTFTALIIEIHDFLKDLNAIHLEPFLKDWPSTICIARPVSENRLPVLSYLPAAVKATANKTELIAKMLATAANQITLGQTYSAQDFGIEFLDNYGWTELIGRRGPVNSSRMSCGID